MQYTKNSKLKYIVIPLLLIILSLELVLPIQGRDEFGNITREDLPVPFGFNLILYMDMDGNKVELKYTDNEDYFMFELIYQFEKGIESGNHSINISYELVDLGMQMQDGVDKDVVNQYMWELYNQFITYFNSSHLYDTGYSIKPGNKFKVDIAWLNQRLFATIDATFDLDYNTYYGFVTQTGDIVENSDELRDTIIDLASSNDDKFYLYLDMYKILFDTHLGTLQNELTSIVNSTISNINDSTDEYKISVDKLVINIDFGLAKLSCKIHDKKQDSHLSEEDMQCKETEEIAATYIENKEETAQEEENTLLIDSENDNTDDINNSLLEEVVKSESEDSSKLYKTVIKLVKILILPLIFLIVSLIIYLVVSHKFKHKVQK